MIMFSYFDKVPACDRRTDILLQHTPRYAVKIHDFSLNVSLTTVYRHIATKED